MKKNNFLIIVFLLILSFSISSLIYILGFNEIHFYNYKYYYYISIIIFLVLILIVFFIFKKPSVEKMKEKSELENTQFISKIEIEKIECFNIFNYSKSKLNEDGFVISSRLNGDINVITTSELHELVIGTTGSGKTTGIVNSQINFLSVCKTKPSMCITDPKGELLDYHYGNLVSRGYKVKVLNLRNPYTSNFFNPFSEVIKKIDKIKEYTKYIATEGKFIVSGETFDNLNDLLIRKKEVESEAEDEIKNIIYSICVVKNKEQPGWEEGARDFIFSLALAFYEDILKGIMPKEKLTLFNLYHNISNFLSRDTDVFCKYLLEGRDKFSKVPGLAKTILLTQDKTLSSYLSEVNGYMQILSDSGLTFISSRNEIDLGEFRNSPTAIFIILPDEKRTRDSFATLFIQELYTSLITSIGDRHCYFILDEFGNLPVINNLESFVTVSRSRGIRFSFILQSFSQLDSKYGANASKTIKSNCNVKIFIGSDDYDTRKSFSELCGNRIISNESKQMGENKSSDSVSLMSYPLVTTHDLEILNGKIKGEGICVVRGYNPIRGVFTPSYLLDKYYLEKSYSKYVGKNREDINLNDIVFEISNVEIKEEVKNKRGKEEIYREIKNLVVHFSKNLRSIDGEIILSVPVDYVDEFVKKIKERYDDKEYFDKFLNKYYELIKELKG